MIQWQDDLPIPLVLIIAYNTVRGLSLLPSLCVCAERAEMGFFFEGGRVGGRGSIEVMGRLRSVRVEWLHYVVCGCW